MHRRTSLHTFVGAIALATLAACGRAMPMQTVQDSAFLGQASLQQRTQQIIYAGLPNGWIMEERRPGLIRGTLSVRRAQVVVDVTYDATRFTIGYVTSTGLNYQEDAGGMVIQGEYARWVNNLQRQILIQSKL